MNSPTVGKILRACLFAGCGSVVIASIGIAVAVACEDASQRPAKEATVRGSVEQIHVADAEPYASLRVVGPGNYELTATADGHGGLILRNVPPGDVYRVRIGGGGPEHGPIRVLSRSSHPGPEFYAAQDLAPAEGYLRTRDGTLLSYRVALPDPEVFGPGPYDLIITYSGYQPGLQTADRHQNRPFEQFTELGYAVAGVNMRGSGCSGGAFDFMEPLTWLDGYDMVESFAAQDWVDNIALGDQSWPGLTQLFVASTQPPSLDAIVAGSVVGDFYRDVFYPGGIANVGFGRIWATGRDRENAHESSRADVRSRVQSDPICAANQALRGQNVSLVETIAAHPYDDEYWQTRSAERLVGRIAVPTLQIVSWQDPQVGGRPAELYRHFAADTPVRLVGVNGFHQYWSGDAWNEIVEFLDMYLGDRDAAEIADYESRNAFVALLESNATGDARGRFTLPSLGAAGEGVRLELGHDLITDDAGSSEGTSTFHYDATPPGSWNDPKQDQVTFTSSPLTEPMVMAGPGSADLWISADASDVDLQVTLSEIRPDGQEMLVQSGWLRASHRALDEQQSTALRPRQLHTAESVVKLTPGAWTLLRVELFPFAHVFRAGSRLRLSVSGPGGAVNAWPWAFDALPGEFDVRIADEFDARSSTLVVPVVRPEDLTVPETLPGCDSVWLQPCRPVTVPAE